jgi:hypothetical protein
MKAKRIFLLTLVSAVLVLSGCSVRIANMTPRTVPTNPSGIYTLSAKTDIKNKAIDPSSLATYVVVDGKQHPMARSEIGQGFYDFDYTIPVNRNSARFYYIVNYRLKTLGNVPGKLKQTLSGQHEFQLTDRYSITLDAERAPVGTQLAVLGRGFSRSDRVFVGDLAAETHFISSNALQFIVPGLTPGYAYAVEVRGGRNIEQAGMLRVDPGLPLRVIPSRLELKTGERQAIAFALDYPAPDGGLYINITTDIQDSIIMPEVLISEGSRTVSVGIEGGSAGRGSLFINARGLSELVVPVTVK